MKKLSKIIPLLLIVFSFNAYADFDVDYKIRRLEGDVRDLQYALQDEQRERRYLETRVRNLEMKLNKIEFLEQDEGLQK
ncbi:MAG: hypothetical protein A3F16_05735 [Deltaproteobacteria bacterium RIFCSPHIGHO2_12_FULL_43_9]|nr:MAG: hypothetical protein A3F16_05735 [Deltaproteobacteria bacterium RIFCSPHIGHO2_12_FULL_43_9]